MSFPRERTDEQRDDLVEQVAREIQFRGLNAPAVHFLNASRPTQFMLTRSAVSQRQAGGVSSSSIC